jgi:hypothetical protein
MEQPPLNGHYLLSISQLSTIRNYLIWKPYLFLYLTAYETQTVGILKETCLTVKDRVSLLLLTIIEPIIYGGFQFKCQYALEPGIGLYYKNLLEIRVEVTRDVLCGLDFADTNCIHFLCYSHIISQMPKWITLSVALFTNNNPVSEKLREDLGLKEINSLFAAVSAEERNLQIPDQPERLSQLTALIKHIDESEKSVRKNSEKTVSR